MTGVKSYQIIIEQKVCGGIAMPFQSHTTLWFRDLSLSVIVRVKCKKKKKLNLYPRLYLSGDSSPGKKFD